MGFIVKVEIWDQILVRRGVVDGCLGGFMDTIV